MLYSREDSSTFLIQDAASVSKHRPAHLAGFFQAIRIFITGSVNALLPSQAVTVVPHSSTTQCNHAPASRTLEGEKLQGTLLLTGPGCGDTPSPQPHTHLGCREPPYPHPCSLDSVPPHSPPALAGMTVALTLTPLLSSEVHFPVSLSSVGIVRTMYPSPLLLCLSCLNTCDYT